MAGLFDFFDGALARLAGRESAFGAFLDSVVDRYSDLLVLLGIVLFYERGDDTVGVFFTMIALVGTVMVSYTKARAQSIGVSCDIGLMERPERMIVLIGGGLFNLLTPTMIALAVLTNVTAAPAHPLHARGLGPARRPAAGGGRARSRPRVPPRKPAEPDATQLRPSA